MTNLIVFSKKYVKKEAQSPVEGTLGEGAVAKISDVNRRFVAAFLALVFAISSLIIGVNFSTKAEDTVASLTPGAVTDEDSGMVLNKYLTPQDNGTYDLTLEAYSTAKTNQINEKIPTDFIIVADQSGSMSTTDMPTGTATVKSNQYLETIANSTQGYYYYDSKTNNYYRVYGVKDYLYRYYAANYWYVGSLIDRFGTDLGWFMSNTSATTTFENQMYFREEVGGKTYYRPITMTVKGSALRYDIQFYYTSASTGSRTYFDRENTTYSSNGKSPWYRNVITGAVMNSGTLWSAADSVVQGLSSDDHNYTYAEVNVLFSKINTGMYINYPMYDRNVGYTKLCYRDINGEEHEVPSNQNSGQSTWEFCNASGQAITTNSGSTRPTYSGLYQFSGTTSRLTALKTALNEFAQAVANETDSFGAVDNKISIIGFSSTTSSKTYDGNSSANNYNNTELLTGDNVTISSNNGVQKATADGNESYYYGTALVDSTNGTVGQVNSKVTAAINAITAEGGTQPEDGLNMAYKVLTNRGATQYTIRSGNQKGKVVDRNTSVIFFTDGQPGNYHTSDQYAEANDVIEAALDIKQYGANLFTIGVFGESDGNPLTYTHATATNSSGEDPNWKYLGGWVESYHDTYPPYSWYCLRREWRPGTDGYTDTANDTIFDYMSVTSSNYPEAEDYIAPEWLSGKFSGNYVAATDGKRHKETSLSTNQYYRMASNQDTLVAAFLQAVSMNNEEMDSTVNMDENAVLTDTISDNFELPADFEDNLNQYVQVRTQKGNYNSETKGVDWVSTTERFERTPEYDLTKRIISVTGFNYFENHITDDVEFGKKLLVTIKGLTPKESVTSTNEAILYSNTSAAVTGTAIIGDGEDNVEERAVNFPRPAITRHSYTLNVTGDNSNNATFKVSTSLTGGTGSLDNVIVVKPDGSRMKYSSYTSTDSQQFEMTNGEVFYFENVPDGYQVQTAITATDTDYTYTWTDAASTPTLNTTTATTNAYNYVNSAMNINSVANTRTVTVKEAVTGSYANEGDTFTPTLYLVPPSGTTVTENMTFGSITWVKDGEDNQLKTTLDAIQGNNTDSVAVTVPAGWTLKVEQQDDNYDIQSKRYAVDDSDTSADIPNDGVMLSGDMTITITNVRDSIPIEGLSDNSNDSHVLLYVLIGLALIALVAGGYTFWKKKDEFGEE